MVKDNIKNLNRYSINDDFENFKNDLLQGNDYPIKLNLPLKAIPLEYITKYLDLTKFENHQKNIDIHFVLEGSELIGINRLENLKPTMEYDEGNDYQLFEGEVKDVIILNSGEFLLLFPGEAHVTGGAIIEHTKVKKIVYKIPF
ncbi:YhcH/YjgK/YiaL family protein [Gelidibacter japonicus]|uniref:YhcH/YjgK/YiaL family protein n=1 Tax=Gelidibacter japonicus TaxID=1962232 RepID=UPI003A93210D